MSTPPPARPFGAPDRGERGIPPQLRHRLTEASRSVNDHVSLKRALTDVARLTVGYIDGADGVGTTLNLDGRVVMTAADQPWVMEVDAVQYGLGQGPCVTAAAVGTTVCTNDLAHDRRWPEFSAAAVGLGVGSVLSLPLLGADLSVGCLNVYSRRPEAFDLTAIDAGNRLAPHAAVAVRDAQLLAVTRTLAGLLGRTTDELTAIDLAVGVLMRSRGLDERWAARELRGMAADQGRTVAAVSRTVLAEANRTTAPDRPSTPNDGRGPAPGPTSSPR